MSANKQQQQRKWFVIAVSGATCSGKSTLSNKLKEKFPKSVVLHQDDYFLDVSSDLHQHVEELNHWNFEIITSLDNDKFYNDIQKILNSDAESGFLVDDFYSEFNYYIPVNCKRLSFIPNFLILDGFLLLNEPRIVGLSDVKIFITLDRETCYGRRFVRTYEPPDPAGYFALCVWPWYEYHKKEVEAQVENVVYLSGMDKRDDIFDRSLSIIIESLLKIE